MAMTVFQKGHQINKGRSGGMRRDATLEIVSQLNEAVKNIDGSKEARDNLHRLVANLIAKATVGSDKIVKGKLVKGTGDLTAILAIIERLEGKPKQAITGPDNGPVQVQYRTVEEVHMYLLARGIDALRVPPPPVKLKIIDQTE
jgi:hypothetical protein